MEEQIPERYRKIIEAQVKEYEAGTNVTLRNRIPDTRTCLKIVLAAS
jgi:hypothetical protein